MNNPNPADFSVDDRPGEYVVRFSVEGEISTTIKAASQQEAEKIAEAMADAIAEGTHEAVLDDVFDVTVALCQRQMPVFRVMRDGKKMKTSHLQPGDLPRDPDENGF